MNSISPAFHHSVDVYIPVNINSHFHSLGSRLPSFLSLKKIAVITAIATALIPIVRLLIEQPWNRFERMAQVVPVYCKDKEHAYGLAPGQRCSNHEDFISREPFPRHPDLIEWMIKVYPDEDFGYPGLLEQWKAYLNGTHVRTPD